jgi:hypothetical protein
MAEDEIAFSARVTPLIQRFESRSTRLTREAYGVLGAIVILLFFGAYVIFQAPVLTSNDITQTLDSRLNTTDEQLVKASARDGEIVAFATAEFRKCMPAYRNFFQPWLASSGDTPDDHAFHAISFTDHLPDGNEIRQRMSALLQSPEVNTLRNIGIQLTMEGCGGPDIFFVLTPDQYQTIISALTGREFSFDRNRLNSMWQEHKTIVSQIAFLKDVERQIYAHKVEEQATGAQSVGGSQSNDNRYLLIRLIQTTITRFGTLAVVGFLVGVLVSLYRYNVRLSAFYLARADLLLMINQRISVSDLMLLASALTPQLAFGKVPPTPAGQVVDVLGAMKGMGGTP